MLYMPVPRVPACMNHTEWSCWRCKGCCTPQPAKQDSGLREVEAFPEAFLKMLLGLAAEGGVWWCERRGCDGRWMGRQRGWSVLAAEAELVSHARSKKMDLPGSTGSVLPILCNHHSGKGGMVLKSLDFNCLLYLKKKSESSQRIETAWSNQSAFWSRYKCLEGKKKVHVLLLKVLHIHPPVGNS